MDGDFGDQGGYHMLQGGYNYGNDNVEFAPQMDYPPPDQMYDFHAEQAMVPPGHQHPPPQGGTWYDTDLWGDGSPDFLNNQCQRMSAVLSARTFVWTCKMVQLPERYAVRSTRSDLNCCL